MNLLSLFQRRTTAPVARERLQILLAHERGIVSGEPDLIAMLREEIIGVVARHVAVEREKVQVRMDRGMDISTLEIEVEVPGATPVKIAARA
jgi:cell division topological specificity factor